LPCSCSLPALAFGSFVNVVAARVPLRRSISKPRSACIGCGTEIAARDNTPIASYLLLLGRCRHCHEHISPIYPAVEALTAALVVACVLAFGATAYTVLASFFVIVLVTLSAADLRYRLVPNRNVLPAAVICLVGMTIRAEPGGRSPRSARGVPVRSRARHPKDGYGRRQARPPARCDAGRNVSVAFMVGFIAALVPAAAGASAWLEGAQDGDSVRPFLRSAPWWRFLRRRHSQLVSRIFG
jgi:hypothetical protein